eukprot:TRINITY_DN574_c0_g1_i1.p1 TRINITY_DN574_c0_g1~~TRINITY_DN574_c0_g1_i1.p1  ORF type:complete len:315 (+),score=67.45 TRINITY_DN574_c0_g1_i1:740-1684(+)
MHSLHKGERYPKILVEMCTVLQQNNVWECCDTFSFLFCLPLSFFVPTFVVECLCNMIVFVHQCLRSSSCLFLIYNHRISSINAISSLCEKTGADVDEVAHAIGADSRIGPKFLQASVGFGGSCFQKDVLNLVYLFRVHGLDEAARYWMSVIDINNWQRMRFARSIVQSMFDSVRSKKIAIFGFAFKKDTADIRETSAVPVAKLLLMDGAQLSVYDPKVSSKDIYHSLTEAMIDSPSVDVTASVEHATDAYAAATGAHAIVILTEWDEFIKLDYHRLHDVMMHPAFLFDGRRILKENESNLKEIGFEYHTIGSKL